MRLVHGLVKRLAASGPGSWFLAPILHRLDAPVIRWSGGRQSLTNWLTGLPVVILTTTGAKSGRPRTLPLVGLLDGPRVVLIASNFGRRSAPGWFYNLKAQPQAELIVAGQAGRYLAREAEDEERERYWRMAVGMYAGFAAYARRAAHRRIRIMVLEPV